MFILINKPKGITSHDVVDRLRNITGERRIGHAGTLDPNASGLMVVGIGRQSTKQLSKFVGLKKIYIADIFLGEERLTDDVEGEIRLKNTIIRSPKVNVVNSVVSQFLGKQKQIPPVYSAVKIKGREAYKRARKGEVVEMKSRDIEVYSVRVINYEYPDLRVEFEVSSGTYIRSLARDLGRKLKTGAYLRDLVRLKVGEFSIEDSHLLEELDKDNWRSFVFDL